MNDDSTVEIKEDLVIPSEYEMMGSQMLHHPDMKLLHAKPRVNVDLLSSERIKDIIFQLEDELRNREES